MRGVEARDHERDALGRDVRDRDVRRRQRLARARRRAGRSSSTPFAAAFRCVASTAAGSWSTASTGREAEARRRDREHARAAADVEQAPALEPVEQLEAEPRGRVPAGAERAPGIDHDRLDPLGRRLPGRPDPELPDAHRPVEVAPALLPVGGHVVGPHLAERGPEPLLARVVGVRDQLEPVGVLDLLEALREELEHQRPRRLGALDRDGRGDAAERAQRKALFSFWKNPSSAS